MNEKHNRMPHIANENTGCIVYYARKNPPEEDEVFLLEVEIFEVACPSALEFVHLEISIILVPTDIF